MHRSWLMALSVVVVACGGTAIIDPPLDDDGGGGSGASSTGGSTNTSGPTTNGSGTGPASGSTSGATSGSGSTSGSMSGTTSGTGPASGSTGSGMMCSTCGEVIQGGGFPNDLCPGSQQLFQDFAECVCFGGPCEAICGDNVCQGDDPSDGCFDCITGDCNEELNACLNDS